MPIRVDGTGQVVLGENVILGYRPAPRIGTGEILLQSRGQGSLIRIGARTTTSNNVVMIAMKSILIGDDCLIGDLVTIYDCDFHEIDPANRNRSAGQILPVNIGNNVWLGSRSMILKGVSLGDNTIVAAGSVVTKSFPSNVVVAGVPAAIVKRIEG